MMYEWVLIGYQLLNTPAAMGIFKVQGWFLAHMWWVYYAWYWDQYKLWYYLKSLPGMY
jgi:hypothetical protein